jgi:Arc/MetJ family transcription regulator
MKKHTTLNLDSDLVVEAARSLGTTGATDTIHRALQEVIDLQKRRRLLEYDLPDLTLESVDDMRRDRNVVEGEVDLTPRI